MLAALASLWAADPADALPPLSVAESRSRKELVAGGGGTGGVSVAWSAMAVERTSPPDLGLCLYVLRTDAHIGYSDILDCCAIFGGASSVSDLLL